MSNGVMKDSILLNAFSELLSGVLLKCDAA